MTKLVGVDVADSSSLPGVRQGFLYGSSVEFVGELWLG